MKLIKEITPVSEESVDGESLYFNPVIYDYVKENGIPLYDLLRCLQSREECLWYFGSNKGWTLVLEAKWFSPKGIGQRMIDKGGERYDKYYYRELLIMDMFGWAANDAETYADMGHGMADDVLFGRLSKLSEKQIKSPLDMKYLSLWDWGFERSSYFKPMIFNYDSVEEGMWYISPLIFGYAKSFERRNLLINYNEMPWSDLK